MWAVTQKNRAIIIFAFLSIVLLLGVYLFIKSDAQERIAKLLPIAGYKLGLKKPTLNPALVTSSNDQIKSFKLKEDFIGKDRFTEKMSGTTLDTKAIQVVITADPAVATNKFVFNDKLISGFSVAYTPDATVISIYLSPEVPTLTSYQYELSRNYLSAVLIADAFEKQKNNNTPPNYLELRKLASEITLEGADAEQLPVEVPTP